LEVDSSEVSQTLLQEAAEGPMTLDQWMEAITKKTVLRNEESQEGPIGIYGPPSGECDDGEA
jgi:hypothetical protein